MSVRPPSPPGGAWAKALSRSLGLSLFLWLFAVILVAFGVHALVGLRTTTRQWNETIHNHAERFSELIRRSTHHSMLLNRKEDVHEIIRTIARTPDVEGVRVYDKQGVVIASGRADEVGRSVDLEAEACVICHDQAMPLRSVPSDSHVRIYTGANGGRVLGLITPIQNAPECAEAGCHASPAEQSILGVLDVKMSMVEADRRLAAVTRQAVLAAVLTALAAGAASALFIYRVVRRPVKRLIAGTRRVAAGDLAIELPEQGQDELGQLARAFNRMTRDLRAARQELTGWSERLERKLLDKTEELGRTQRQAIHMEKMASLGKLAATVAHELNNPLAGILNYAKLVERTLGEPDGAGRAEELARYLRLVQKEADRSGRIVRNLLLFARRSGAQMAHQALHPIVDRALMLVRHHLEMAGVTLERRLEADDDTLVCDADQLQQALVALLVNAVEAMRGGGTLRVSTRGAAEQRLRIEISDTGHGIDPDALPHIFEPFFSTKEQAGAAGLGLAVVYGIVERHGGSIDVESTPGRGATFRIRLPRRPPAPSADLPETDVRPAEEVSAHVQSG